MEKKIYVFGIGGTGSRVIKSLTMLLATGIDVNGFKIVPVIIDPDQANGDVTRTIEILKSYDRIRKQLDVGNSNANKFFNTEISDKIKGYKLELSDVKNDKFKNYIGYSSLDESNKALINLLFSEENLNSDMEVGFKGNPNIGSVVLNQFEGSQDFKEFTSTFGTNDRIFIISSIFGGTGAAGFPLLLKNIRKGGNVANSELLKNAPIGAVTMLPYFGVAPDENSKIDKATFISKTKSALQYYEQNICDNKAINALYYIGDEPSNDYENKEGSVEQKNDAHFLELVAALSIIDFAKTDSDELLNKDGKAEYPKYKEFGIKEDVPAILFSHLGDDSQLLLQKNLTQFQLFNLFLKNKLNNSEDSNWFKELKLKPFLTSSFYTNLKTFNNYFTEWLAELSNNKRSFSPYNLNADDANLFEMVNGLRPKTGFLEKGRNYGRFDYMLSNKLNDSKSNSQEQYFMSLFYNTTEELVKEKYNF
jgi:hypothetical protein